MSYSNCLNLPMNCSNLFVLLGLLYFVTSVFVRFQLFIFPLNVQIRNNLSCFFNHLIVYSTFSFGAVIQYPMSNSVPFGFHFPPASSSLLSTICSLNSSTKAGPSCFAVAIEFSNAIFSFCWLFGLLSSFWSNFDERSSVGANGRNCCNVRTGSNLWLFESFRVMSIWELAKIAFWALSSSP